MLFSWTVFRSKNKNLTKEISFKRYIGTQTGTLIHVMLLADEDMIIISYNRKSSNVFGIGCPFYKMRISMLFSWRVYHYKK